MLNLSLDCIAFDFRACDFGFKAFQLRPRVSVDAIWGVVSQTTTSCQTGIRGCFGQVVSS